MAESPSRKLNKFDGANGKEGHNRCNAIFEALLGFLTQHFPDATVVILRGQNIFDDLARLTYAKTVICSVSTFCFWPAVAAGGAGTSTCGI